MHFPYGTLLAEIPEGFTPPECWPEFGNIAFPPAICAREAVGENPKGVRWSLWPLCFEQYICDAEPSLAESNKGALARNRIVYWKRIASKEIPEGWRAPSEFPWRIDGFHQLEQGKDYAQAWFHNARNDLKMWKKLESAGTYTIETILFKEFAAAYKKSTVAKKYGKDFLWTLERKMRLPRAEGTLVFWGVRNTNTGEIIAGTAAHYPSSSKSSVRECPFALPEGRRAYATTGLIDHWFAESEKRGVVFQIFTFFWHEGESSSWKKFSEFKSHFGLQYVAYPPLLRRFVRGKLF